VQVFGVRQTILEQIVECKVVLRIIWYRLVAGGSIYNL
jgi:hypothetical protein